MIARFKLAATALDIKRMEVGPSGGEVEFNPNPEINIDGLMRYVAANPNEVRFAGPEKINIRRDMPLDQDRFDLVQEVFKLIAD